VAPQNRQAFVRMLQQLKQKDSLTMELSLITATKNQEISVKLSLKQFQVDELLVNSIIVTDITQLKQAEIALQESESKYRLLFESNPNPLWVIDLETLAFLAVNRDAIAHYGVN
jgi:PAS domain-containing protein